MELILALIDLISILVYLDLALVNRYQVHLFTPLLKLLDKNRLKQYQPLYYQSLKREYYCVSDKVSVSGTTFTVVFAFIYGISLLCNLFDGLILSKTAQFYMIGLPYIGYTLFCLHTYKARREMCFYCKYTCIQNALVLIIMIAFYMDHFPKLYIFTCVALFVLSLMARGMARKERARKLKREQEKREIEDAEKFE